MTEMTIRSRRGLTTFEMLVLFILIAGAGLYFFGKEMFSWGPPPGCAMNGAACKPGVFSSSPLNCCQGLSCAEGDPGVYRCVPG
jgi:hypothetical protein